MLNIHIIRINLLIHSFLILIIRSQTEGSFNITIPVTVSIVKSIIT